MALILALSVSPQPHTTPPCWFSPSLSSSSPLPFQEAPETLKALQESGPLVISISCMSEVTVSPLPVLETQLSDDEGKDRCLGPSSDVWG